MLEQRYKNPKINRQYWLTDSVIKFKRYTMEHIDKVAAELSETDIEAFKRVVDTLNKED